MASRRKTRSASPQDGTAAPARSFRLLVGGLIAIAAVVAIGVIGWRAFPPDSATGLRVSGPIILISIDTLRADRLPVYGYQAIMTPAINAFAADAVVFERAYTHAPQTLPAHVSMLSGQLPFEHGVRDNLGFSVAPGQRLLPDMLREHGFDTAGVVSSYVLRDDVGLGRNFDVYDSRMPVVSSETSIGQVQRSGLESLAVAERWLDTVGSDRFFLFLHMYEPHKPYAPPDRYSAYDPYDGEVAFTDEIVGRFLDSLRARGLYDAATIIFTSDHGEGLGDHGELEHGIFVYNESIQVPLIVKLPAAVNGGARVAQPVQHIDLVPTILDLVGAPALDGLIGRSLTPLLVEPRARIPEQGIYSEALYSRYHFGWSELLALTDSRYRFINAPRAELYDLERDPEERSNVAADRLPTAVAMRAALDRLIAGTSMDAPSAVSDEARARLEALGYVGRQAAVSPEVNGNALPDPKDKVEVLAQYRHAVQMAGRRQFARRSRSSETSWPTTPPWPTCGSSWARSRCVPVVTRRRPTHTGAWWS